MAVGVGKQARWQPAFGSESETAEGREELGHAMSSIYHMSKSAAPVTSSTATPIPLCRYSNPRALARLPRRMAYTSNSW